MQRTIVIGAGRFDPAIHQKETKIWPECEDTLVAAKVLIHTLKTHSRAVRDGSVGIVNTYDMLKPQMRKQRNPTPFSLVRFWVPSLCRNQGRGLYLDADMIVFDDVEKLFESATGDHRVWRANRESVIIVDCERVRNWDPFYFARQIDDGVMKYDTFMTSLNSEVNVGTLPPEWNCLDMYEPRKTKLLHYTQLRTQPWRKDSKHLFASLWWTSLNEAIEAGEVSADDLVISGLAGDKRLKQRV